MSEEVDKHESLRILAYKLDCLYMAVSNFRSCKFPDALDDQMYFFSAGYTEALLEMRNIITRLINEDIEESHCPIWCNPFTGKVPEFHLILKEVQEKEIHGVDPSIFENLVQFFMSRKPKDAGETND